MIRSEKKRYTNEMFRKIIGARTKCFEVIGTENNSVFQYVEKKYRNKKFVRSNVWYSSKSAPQKNAAFI